MAKKMIPNKDPSYRFQNAWVLGEGTVEELIEVLKKLDPKAKVYHPEGHECWQGIEINTVTILSEDKDLIEDGDEEVKKGSILLCGW